MNPRFLTFTFINHRGNQREVDLSVFHEICSTDSAAKICTKLENEPVTRFVQICRNCKSESWENILVKVKELQKYLFLLGVFFRSLSYINMIWGSLDLAGDNISKLH